MALPAGVTTVTVTIGPVEDYSGTPLAGTVVTFTPSRGIVWTATGDVLLPRPMRVTLDSNGFGSVVLPATDQNGFADGAGHVISSFGYLVSWKFLLRAMSTPATTLISLPASAPNVKLGALVPMPYSAQAILGYPVVTSIGGMTGSVSIPQLAAAVGVVASASSGSGSGRNTVSMAERSMSFIESMMASTTPLSSRASITPDVTYPASYTGPVAGSFALDLSGEATTQRCRINVTVPAGTLAESYRGMVFGAVSPAPGAGYTLQAYKEVDAEYAMPSTCAVDATTGNFGLDLSNTPDFQKGPWRIGLLDGNGNQVGELWPSPVTYTDLKVESRVITDTSYLASSQYAAVNGRWNFLITLNGRKQFRLVRISTGAVLAESVPLTGNVRSYLPAVGEPGYGTKFDQQCYSYDQAIALLAAIAAGRKTVAAKLVAGLMLMQTSGGARDGGFVFSAQQLSPNYGDTAYRTGAHSICLYALLAYMQAYPLDASLGYTSAATRGLTYLTTMLATSGNRAGLYLGGSGNYTTIPGQPQGFDAGYDITWASTEHNFDTWHALNLAATVLPSGGYRAKADTLKANIISKLWNANLGRFLQGIQAAGPDTADPLDMHSWGAIWACAVGRLDIAATVMADAALSPFYFQRDGCAGYAPAYPADPGYPQANATVWAEGTFGVALAYLALGDVASWQNTMLAMSAAQSPDGAFPYVTTANTAYEWTPSKATIGASWSVLASAGCGIWGVTQTEQALPPRGGSASHSTP